MSCNGCALNNIDTSRPAMLDTYDWLDDLPDTSHISDIIEVRFKSTRKEYYKNTENLSLKRNDLVVVATSPGHDIGTITLTGRLAEKQFERKIKKKDRYQLSTIYRIATDKDKETWEAAKEKEKPTMIRAREIVKELHLQMKIGDVEYRADGGKAIFYYIADGRVDFRELIKVYAKEFKVRIEMKQIGARQEAGRIGGIGSCGRELCCSSWRTDFSSISTESLIKQGLSTSASKMAGACGKLKCCLLYELDNYVEAGKEFPKELLYLESSKGVLKPFKTDYLAKTVWYLREELGTAPIKLSTTEVKRIIQQNKRGIKPDIELAPEVKEEMAFVTTETQTEPAKFNSSNNKRNRGKNNRKKRNRKNYRGGQKSAKQ